MGCGPSYGSKIFFYKIFSDWECFLPFKSSNQVDIEKEALEEKLKVVDKTQDELIEKVENIERIVVGKNLLNNFKTNKL